MDERRRREGMIASFAEELPVRDAAQLVVHQGPELLFGSLIACRSRIQDQREFVFQRRHSVGFDRSRSG